MLQKIDDLTDNFNDIEFSEDNSGHLHSSLSSIKVNKKKSVNVNEKKSESKIGEYMFDVIQWRKIRVDNLDKPISPLYPKCKIHSANRRSDKNVESQQKCPCTKLFPHT